MSSYLKAMQLTKQLEEKAGEERKLRKRLEAEIARMESGLSDLDGSSAVTAKNTIDGIKKMLKETNYANGLECVEIYDAWKTTTEKKLQIRRTHLEQLLSKIESNVLSLDLPGGHNNFFSDKIEKARALLSDGKDYAELGELLRDTEEWYKKVETKLVLGNLFRSGAVIKTQYDGRTISAEMIYARDSKSNTSGFKKLGPAVGLHKPMDEVITPRDIHKTLEEMVSGAARKYQLEEFCRIYDVQIKIVSASPFNIETMGVVYIPKKKK